MASPSVWSKGCGGCKIIATSGFFIFTGVMGVLGCKIPVMTKRMYFCTLAKGWEWVGKCKLKTKWALYVIGFKGRVDIKLYFGVVSLWWSPL